MIERYLIPIGAGLVSAIAFISVALDSGGLGVLLYLIIPLPVLLAGLALGWPSAFIAALSAAAFILLAGSPFGALAYFALQGLPPVVLSYLALLNRPAADGSIEWYPPGRLIIASALMGGAVSIALMMALGGSYESVREKVKPFVEQLFEKQIKDAGESSPLTQDDLPALTDAVIALMPAMSAVLVTLILVLNLWLAGRIAVGTGQLQRPWPDLGLLDFPRGTPLALALASAGAFLPGLAGMASGALSGTLLFSYVLLGLAIAHYTSRGVSWRTPLLWAIYVSLFVFNPAFLLVALIGLADSIWPMRRVPPD